MKKLLFYSTLFFSTLGFSQGYTTPGTGVNWTIDSLVANNSDSVLSVGGKYFVKQDITVAKNDTLRFLPGDIINLDSNVRVTVEGATFIALGTTQDKIRIISSDSLKPYDGFRFEDSARVIIDYAIIKNGGGLKVLTPYFILKNSRLLYNREGVASGAVVDLSYGSPLIENNWFLFNDKPAVSSPANREVSARILNNYMKGNNQLNENRPQINMGTTGADTLKIIGNTIIGDTTKIKVGGIAISNFFGATSQINAVIKDNVIQNNRYGITVAGGNAYVEIVGNVIEDNDTQNAPMLGGSGISVNATDTTQTIIATDNKIRRNLWGITIINKAKINLGDGLNNPGNNVFADNGNGGVIYAVYNNTSGTIMAKNNCWIEGQINTLADAESVIFDQANDSTLGEVIYDPVGCGSTVQIIIQDKASIQIYPNPIQSHVYFKNNNNFNRLSVYNLSGKLLQATPISYGTGKVAISMHPGVYLIRLEGDNSQLIKKIVVQ